MDFEQHLNFKNVKTNCSNIRYRLIVGSMHETVPSMRLVRSTAELIARFDPRLAAEFATAIASLCALSQEGALKVDPVNTCDAFRHLALVDDDEDGIRNLRKHLHLVITAAYTDLNASEEKRVKQLDEEDE